MDIFNARKIHCIGIGGIGVSALAQLWRAQGKEVSGSDAEESEVTRALERQGVRVEIHERPPLNLPLVKGEKEGVDLVVYSDAVPEDNIERAEARRRGIPELSYAQALGQVSWQYRTIVVTGTHGKSTTTAMLGLILEAAGFDPLVIVGSKVPGWPLGNLRLTKTLTPNPLPKGEGVFKAIPSPHGRGEGEGKQYFVVEGDDYRDHFLELQPCAVVVTSIEWDHPDYFRDQTHTVESFKRLVEKVPMGGFVVLNQDDAGGRQLYDVLQHSNILKNVRMLVYGRHSEMWRALMLKVPGEFNRYNATAAATAAMELGVSLDVAKKALHEFKGIWRRFEIVGELPPPLTPPRAGGESVEVSPPLGGGVRGGLITVISDYAHHPTAIRETMKAAREQYPDRRLVLVYQPHQHSRTKRLFSDFVEVLKDVADVVILSEIYAVKGRMEDRDVSSRDIVEQIIRYAGNQVRRIEYGGDLQETRCVALEQIKPGDVVIFMGAGDIDRIARELGSMN